MVDVVVQINIRFCLESIGQFHLWMLLVSLFLFLFIPRFDTTLFFPYPVYSYNRMNDDDDNDKRDPNGTQINVCAVCSLCVRMNEKWKVFETYFFLLFSPCYYSVIFIINIIFKHVLFGNSNKKITLYKVRMNGSRRTKRESCYLILLLPILKWMAMSCGCFFSLLYCRPFSFLFARLLAWNLQFSFVIKCCSVIYLVVRKKKCHQKSKC